MKKSFIFILKAFFGISIIFVVGGIGGVISDRFVMPWLSSFPSLQKCSFFQKANEKVTIVNQTKKITVKEDFSVANIAEKVSPSIVSIIKFKNIEENETNLNKIKSSQDIQKNIKTGLILTNDGLIISVLNEELRELFEVKKLTKEEINDLWDFKVLANDNKEFDAEIRAIDKFSDLVFYKIEGTDLSVPSLGESSKIEVGEKIIVCGNAGGEYQNSFSSGLVKEKDQTFTLLNSELSSSEKLEGAILLDAKIENRNVGGAALDYNGNVIGIIHQIEKDGEKVGFVIPIDDAKKSIDKILNKDDFSNPVLGLYYLSINREISLLNNLEINRGALVHSFSGQQGLAVIKGSAADEAGIKIGDIITGIDDKPVDLDNSLSSLISEKSPAEKVKINLIRNKKEIELEVELN